MGGSRKVIQMGVPNMHTHTTLMTEHKAVTINVTSPPAEECLACKGQGGLGTSPQQTTAMTVSSTEKGVRMRSD